MTKKKYILEILEHLVDDWDFAKWLNLVVLGLEKEKDINFIFEILKNSINKISDKKLKEKIKNSFKKIRQEENQEKNLEKKDLIDLENELEQLL